MACESGKTQSPSKLFVLLAFSLLVPMATASVLGVGGSGPPSFVAPGGSTIKSTSGTITAPTFTASYFTWVTADPANTFCSGCLDFAYIFTDLGPDVNQRYTMTSFAGFLVDVGTNPFGTHDPITVARSSVAGGPVISFNFNQFGVEIQPGQTTVDLVIQTNAVHWTSGFLSAQDGTAGSGVAFQPAGAPIPEPASLILLGGGLIAIGGFLRKSRFGK